MPLEVLGKIFLQGLAGAAGASRAVDALSGGAQVAAALATQPASPTTQPASAKPLPLTPANAKPRIPQNQEEEEEILNQAPKKATPDEPGARAPKKFSDEIIKIIEEYLKNKGIEAKRNSNGTTSFHPGKDQSFNDFVSITLGAMKKANPNVPNNQFGLEIEFPKDIGIHKAVELLNLVQPPENRQMMGKIIIQGREFHLEDNGGLTPGPKPLQKQNTVTQAPIKLTADGINHPIPLPTGEVHTINTPAQIGQYLPTSQEDYRRLNVSATTSLPQSVEHSNGPAVTPAAISATHQAAPLATLPPKPPTSPTPTTPSASTPSEPPPPDAPSAGQQARPSPGKP